MTTRWARWAAVALLLGGLAAAVGLTPLTNNDIWLHLTTGRLILERGAVPRVDEYSFTRAGAPYVAHEWLAQILFWLVYRSQGAAGLIALKTLALFSASLLVLCLAARLGASPAASLAAGAASTLAMASHLYVRPHLFTFVLLAAVSLLLAPTPERGRHGAAWWVTLLLLQALWANVHGGFVLGIALAFLLGRWLPAAAMAAVSLINPYGWKLYQFVFLFTDPVFRRRIKEWAGPFEPPFAGSFHFYVYLAVLAATIGAIVVMVRRGRWGPAAALAGFGLLSFASKRNASVLAIVALPWIAAAPSLALPGRRPHAGAAPARSTITVAACVLIVSLLAAWLGLPYEGGAWRRPGIGIGENVPVAAVDAIISRGIEGRALASFAFASYITFRCWPASTVLIDSRLDVYGGAMVERYFQSMADPDQARRLLRAERPDYALLSYRLEDTGGVIDALDADPGWALVYFDDLSMLYLKDDPRWAAEVERSRYSAISPRGLLAGRLPDAPAGQLLQETERALSEAPGSRVARLMRAVALQRAARHEEALEWINRSGGVGSGDAQEQVLLLGLRATSLAALGRKGEAVDTARQILVLMPDSAFALSLIQEMGGTPPR